jgi:pantoate--beta-alanine ligase
MQAVYSHVNLRKALSAPNIVGKSVGFVPTMGALHHGHLSLVKQAKSANDIVVCSIFVNPTQFNNADDLAKYPRLLEQDLALLRQVDCDFVYLPEVSDLYPNGTHADTFDFGALASVMEGKYRPGHFQGVATVVKRLFNAVQPTRAYFGEKDYQQLAIIRALVNMENLPVEVIGCETQRETDGLAMSSRNLRLNPALRHAAPAIYESLLNLKANHHIKSLEKARTKAIEEINSHPNLAVEYLSIVNAETLQDITHWDEAKHVRACTAVYAGDIRLIDNIALY